MAGGNPISTPKIDTSQVYHATREEVAASRARAAQRQALKAEFVKKFTNPMNGLQAGGHVFDPAMQRFMSMKVSKGDFYRFNTKNAWGFVWLTVIPVLAIYKHLNSEHEKRERDFRSGAIPYSERAWKYD